MSFADNLRHSRESAGLSQMELCRRSGISIDSLRNWEQGRVLPRIDAVVKLAIALGVSVDVLVKGMEDDLATAPETKSKARKQRTVGERAPSAKKDRKKKGV